MMLLQKTIFGKSFKEPNLYLGGWGSLYNTPALLASKLEIPEEYITNFRIIGNDLQCFVSTDLLFNNSFFLNDSNITHIKGDVVVNIGTIVVFRNTPNLTEINLPNATQSYYNNNVINSYIISGTPNLKKVILPKVRGLFNNHINVANLTFNELDLSGVERICRAAIRGVKNEVINLRKLKTVVNYPTNEALPYITSPNTNAIIEVNSFLLTSNSGGIDEQTLKIKELNPGVTIRFYDDNNNLISTL